MLRFVRLYTSSYIWCAEFSIMPTMVGRLSVSNGPGMNVVCVESHNHSDVGRRILIAIIVERSRNPRVSRLSLR
jgi:hypothetical protein